MSNCGCNQTPIQSCGASLQVPVDVLVNPSNNPCPVTGSDLAFFVAPTGFVVPPSGSQTSIQVPNGSVFAVGQWIQFVNPAGTFRIMSITGNTLSLLNASADGVTPIDGNPVFPYQYGANAQFVTVAQPTQLTQQDFNARVQQAISQATSLCLAGIPAKSAQEQVFLLGYLKAPVDSSCASGGLRKMPVGGPYLNETGKLIFSQAIEAPAFNTPVPSGGIPSSNSTVVNPNSGTGSGLLLPFINPTTGLQSFIDLFSGAINNSGYEWFLSPTGQITLRRSQRIIYPQSSNAIFHTASGDAYGGFSLSEINISSLLAQDLSWVTQVEVEIYGYMKTDDDGKVMIKVGGRDVEIKYSTTGRFSYSRTVVTSATQGKFNFEVLTRNSANPPVYSPVNFSDSTPSLSGDLKFAIKSYS